MRIIIAHEDIVVRKKLRHLLEKLGHYVVDESNNGLQAYNMYMTYQPDIIFLNFKMPIYNGEQTLERILNYQPKALCIILTDEQEHHKIFNLLEKGAVHYLKIPFDELNLSKLLKDVQFFKKEME
jgi:CheY-like chemotaxis protein